MEAAKLSYDVTEPASEETSCGKKNPIILLHGMTATKDTWNIFKQRIADNTGRKVYALDARNHGDSEWTDQISFQDMAKDVSHFMDIMDIPTAILAGHSMGGKVAMMLAINEPGKVEKLVVEDFSPKPPKLAYQKFPLLYLNLMKKSLEVIPPESDIKSAKKKVYDFFSSSIPGLLGSGGNQNARENAESTYALEKTANGFRWKVNIEALEKMALSPTFEHAVTGTYSGPTVFIYGTKSVCKILDDRDYIQECFPEVTFVPIEGATHSVHREYPEDFLNALVDFVNK